MSASWRPTGDRRRRSGRCRRSRRSSSRSRSCRCCRSAAPANSARLRRTLRTGRSTPPPNLPYEGRTETHQSRDSFGCERYFVSRMGANPNASFHPALPNQTIWGFNRGGEDFAADPPMSPGPVVKLQYGHPSLIRRYNQLPPPEQNGGLRRAGGLDALPQLPLRPRQRWRTVRPGTAALLLPRPVLRLLPQHAARRLERPRELPRRARQHPGGARLPVVPRPPGRPHGREHLQGPRRPLGRLQRLRHGRREHGAPPAELPGLRRAARARGQAHRPCHRPPGLRHVQLRRPARRTRSS